MLHNFLKSYDCCKGRGNVTYIATLPAVCLDSQPFIVAEASGAYYAAIDQTVHKLYVSGSQWVDLNITAARARPAHGESGRVMILTLCRRLQ